VADFLFDFFRSGDGLGDFVLEDFPVTAAEAVNGHLDRSLGELEAAANPTFSTGGRF
jgi:hypothetical protein